MPAENPNDVVTEFATTDLGEAPVASDLFYPGGRWKSPMAMGRIARSLTNRATLTDAVPLQGALVLTATRVVIYPVELSFKTGFGLGPALFAWQRETLTATAQIVEQSHTASGASVTSGHSGSKKFLRLTLATPDGEFAADLPPQTKATNAIVKGLDADKLAARPSRWWH
jgi:hypothetical protein